MSYSRSKGANQVREVMTNAYASRYARYKMKTTFYLLAIVILLTSGLSVAKGANVTATAVFERIVSNSLVEGEIKKFSSKQIPKGFTNEQFYQLARQLKLYDWDLETHGVHGINYIENAFTFCLYELAKKDGGEVQLINLLKDKSLGWDAGHSLMLGDAIVKKGAPCLPLLSPLRQDIVHVSHYIQLIEQGAKTSI